MRIVFLGSPPFATPVLERLLSSDHEVVALVTPPDRPRGRGRAVVESELVQLARARGLEVVQPATTKDPAFVEALRAFEPDVLAVASYGEILRTDVLELAPHGALNVHGSLLPRWRGASPVQAAILAGDAETGISVQRMVLALDEGDVLLERRTSIGPEETAGELFDRLAELGGEVLVEALDGLAAGTLTATPQDDTAATYCRKLRKDAGDLDWSQEPAQVLRHVRAMSPWPGARTWLPDGRVLGVLEAEPAERPAADAASGNPDEAERAAPGRILGTDALVVACGLGALRLTRVKPAGKKAMSDTDFLRGARLEPGACLGPAPAR